MRIGILGPTGSFTEQAAIKYDANAETIMYTSIDDILFAVDEGKIETGIVPFENSTEGTVNITLDTIIFDTDIFIKDQVVMPVIQNLMVNKNYKGEPLDKIMSHSQSLAQCRNFLKNNYAGVITKKVSSNSEAARIVSCSSENIAAIGPEFAAQIYGLEILQNNIQDQKLNLTSFIVVTKEDTSIPVKNYKTTFAFATLDKPGQLHKILDILSLWDLNMTKILSRPMKNEIGKYVFYVDIEYYDNINDVEDALAMVKRKTQFFKKLGSYPVV